MKRRYRFPGSARLSRSGEFEEVHRRGIRLREFPLLVRALPRADGQSRLGLSVGSAAGKPVLRNRWKRAIREAFRLHRHRLSRPFDVVVRVDWNASQGHVKEVEEAFIAIVRKLNARQTAHGG